jgi:hypothetical protein
MKMYRTAMGKSVDMSALAAKNENTRAVGNMKVNARGDKIDSNGRVIQPVTERVTNKYSQTVGNKSAQSARPQGRQVTPPKPVIKEELTQAERELEDSFEDDLEIEQIKAKETKGK